MRRGMLLVAALILAGCGSDSSPEQVSQDGSSAPNKSDQKQPPETTPTGTASKPGSSATTESIDLQPLLAQAASHTQKREFAAAVAILNKIVTTHPDVAEGYFRRAGILADVGQDRDALVDFNTAIKLNPENPAYRNMRGFFLLTRQQHAEAIKDFSEAVRLDPKYSQAYNNRGLAILSTGKLEDAIQDFDKAAQLNPKYVDAYNNRGFAYFNAGDLEKASADFDKALELNPEYINAYNNRGLLRFRLEEYEKAVEDFTAAIERDRTNVKYYQHRGEAYQKLGRKQEAQADADKIAWLVQLNQLNINVAQEPKNPDSYIQRASHLLEGGEQKIGLANFEAALRIDPKASKVYTSRAAFWLARGEFDKAIADCDRSIEVAPRLEAYSIRGDAYLGKGDYDKAIADYTQAKRLDVDVAQAYFLRSKARHAAGQLELAREDLGRALKIDPGLQVSQ